MSEGRERDLVLAPNEYAYILDETKGNVIAYVGPHKTSLANTDRPVTFEPKTRRFLRCVLEDAITAFPFLLEYDESLEAVELSTGTPKTEDDLLRTVYLRSLNNKVSDRVSAETADLCRVQVLLSYRVNFEGPPEHWFNVENYVKFLTDHMRSLLRNAIKGHGLERFYNASIDIVRDALLGLPAEDGHRPGRRLPENGMHVYDVEVLDVSIGDEDIAGMLVSAQHDAVQQAIGIAARMRELDATRRTEAIRQEIAQARSMTVLREMSLKSEEVRSQVALTAEEITAEAEAERQRLQARLERQEGLDRVNLSELGREQSRRELELEKARRQMDQRLALLEGETQAVIRKAEAVSPDLIAALQSYSDRALAERVAETMAPLAILGGHSVGDVFSGLLHGTALEGVLKRRLPEG